MQRTLITITAVVLLLQLAGCGTPNENQTNKEQAAIEFPHVLSTLPPLQLVLVGNSSDIGYRVTCVESGHYQSVSIEYHTANADGGSERGGAIEALPTCTPGTVVMEDLLLTTTDIPVGDTVEVTFKVTAPSGRDQKVTHSYTKGEDGLLYKRDS